MNARIAELIKALGIRKKEFAENIGISTGNLSDWLRGKTEPSARAFTRIYEKYNVNLNWLIAGQGPMFNDSRIISEERAAYEVKKAKPEDVANLQVRIEQLEKEMREWREKK